jgi:hypothetical protein
MTSATKPPDWEDAHHAGHFARDAADQAWKANGQGQIPPHLIQTSAQFVAGFTPPEYVVDGILQRRFCYAFTAKTGTGKTAIMLLLAAHTALGQPIGDREIEQGRVLYFAGENPDDIRMRWIAMADQVKFDIETVNVNFIPGRFKISEMWERIRAEIAETGDVTLIIVDTSAAYFEGDDENNNVAMGVHARRLRSLAEMPGGPCIVIPCHPIKNAADDNLVPRGGGAFVNEMDGNLTAIRDDATVVLHWGVKFRGPDFAPLSFQLRTVTHERLTDSKGRALPIVVASYLSDAAQGEMAKTARSDEDKLLAVLVEHGNASQAELATLLGWRMRDGRPYKVLVARTLSKLKRAKLITIDRDNYTLTKKGKKAIDKASSHRTEAGSNTADLFEK